MADGGSVAVRNRGWWGLILVMIAGLALIPWAVQVRTANGNRSWIDARGPAATALHQLEERFGRQDGFVVLVTASDVLASPAVDWMRETVSAIAACPGVAGVDSILTARDVKDDDGEPVPVALTTQPRERILGHPLYRGLLVAGDGRSAGLFIRLAATLDEDGVVALEERLRTRLDQRPPPVGVQAQVGGLPAQQQAINRAVVADQHLTVPVSIVLLALVLVLVLRDVRLVLLALGAIGSALVWTFACLALTGQPIDALLGLLPPLIMGIAVATSLHLSFAVGDAIAAGEVRPGRAALRRTSMPLALATLTTMAGVGGLWWGAVPAIRTFAPWAALGVLFAAVWPFLWLLAAAPLLPARAWTRLHDGWAGRHLGHNLGALAGWCHHRRRAVIATYLMAIAGGAWACLHLHADADFVHALPERDPVRQAHAAIDRDLTGTLGCDLLIDCGRPPTTADLTVLDGLVRTLRSEGGFVHVLALSDAVALVRGGDTRRDAATIVADLRLFARDVHDRFLATGFTGREGTLLRVMARQHDGSIAAACGAARRAEMQAQAAFPGAVVQVASAALLLDETTGRIVPSIAQGLVVSLVANVLLLLVFLRRLRLAVVGLPLAGLPLLFTYSILPAVGWPLDVGVSMIACVALGIIMDDAIHMAYALHRHGDADTAARSVGPVLVAACLALSLAFSACALGGFTYTRRFGTLLAAAFIVGLIVNLTLAPALMRKERDP